jgi:hypothetical protein
MIRHRLARSCLLIAVIVLGGCVHGDKAVVAATVVAPPMKLQARPRLPEETEMQFLAALEHADSVEIVSLASREAEITRRSHADTGNPDRGSDEWQARNEAELDAAWCTAPEACIEGDHVLGRVAVVDAVARRELLGHLRGWLDTRPSEDYACIPEFRHAVEFVTNGVRRQVLLCYQCGQYTLRQDGEDIVTWGQAGSIPGRDWFAARFAAAGIPVDVPPRD